MSKLFIRTWLFNKRLLKKPSFICILSFCLLFVFSFSAATADSTGILTVAVASEERDSEVFRSIADSLDNGGMIDILFLDAADAVLAVESGKVDAAWIFPSGIEKRIGNYVSDINEDNFVVSVIQREENVLLQISREKLMSALYPHISNSLYKSFMEMRYPSIAEKGDSFLNKYYSAMEAEGDELFRIVTVDGSAVTSDNGVLLSPVRGILSVLTVIGGLAVSLSGIRDAREGRFDMIPERKRFGIYFVYNLIAVFDIALVSLVAIAVSGLTVSLGREIAVTVVFVFFAAAFCTFLRVLFANEIVFGVLIPFVAVISITVCPIFININIPVWIRLLIPSYGYLCSIYSYSVLPLWIAISCLCFTAAYVVFRLRAENKKLI